ncbi:maleylpyruvate isomerase N-terminal domain-containing protein [Streptomyces sp. NPDC054796]
MPTPLPRPERPERPGALDHARYCAELTEQARQFHAVVRDADLGAPVPTCPEWTLRELTVHLGGAYRWMAEIVRTRASANVPDEDVPAFAGPGTAPDGRAPSAEALGDWFSEGALLLVEQLLAAGPDEPVWSWSGDGRAGFWARRATHETVIHRADACLATGTEFTVGQVVAADCLDEWLEIATSPVMWQYNPNLHKLTPRAGSTLHLHATDVRAPEGGGSEDGDGEGGEGVAPSAEWLIDVGADGLAFRHAHEKATVALRGPVADVLCVLYRRLPRESDRVQVLGEAELLDLWLEVVSFG